MDRREFLKATVPTAALMHAGWGGLLYGDDNSAKRPPVRAYDVVVIGGNLAGCFAALHAVRRGLRVLVIERRTFLATDITATMRPWLHEAGFETLYRNMKDLFLPDEEQPEVGVPFEPGESAETFGEDIPLFCGTIKKQFMAALREWGVDVLLMTGVWGVLADQQRKKAFGVAVANKFGLHVARCRSIIDAREPPPPDRDRSLRQFSYSLEFYGVADDAASEVAVYESLGLLENKVWVHRGKRRAGQCFVEFHFVAHRGNAEPEARRKAEALCRHLIEHEPAFAKAHLVQLAWETLELGGQRPRVTRPGYSNYVSVGRYTGHGLSCQDVLDMDARTKPLAQNLALGRGGDAEALFIHHAGSAIPLEKCEIAPVEDIHLNEAIQRISFDLETYLPRILQRDVVIAGGGTAGAMAAMGAAERNAKVMTIEYFPELGGTKTLGRVSGYYWGYKETALYRQTEEGIKAQSTLLGGKSRICAMMFYLRKQATQKNGKLQTNSIVCGATKDGDRVTGIVVEAGGDVAIISGKVIIDATGDGDVAAFAGAAWHSGNRRMSATQNYSQWDVNPGLAEWKDASTNRDYDILMNHHLSEFQRGYQLSHEQSHYYDFASMLTVRESRRIVGEYTITLKDVVEDRHHADVICLASSDYDPHHFGDTALTRVGCLLPHGISAVVEIPYRALLPKGLRGLLVSAKAISQTHNALQFTRMSFDVMTLGYVTGWIAALACQAKQDPHEFKAESIQTALSELDIVPAVRLARPVEITYDQSHLETQIEGLVAGKENSLIRVLALPGETVEPLLEARFRKTEDGAVQRRFAKALAWLGNPVGKSFILGEMKTLYSEEREKGVLPWEYYRKDKDSSYWAINQDIVLLVLSGDEGMMSAILALADSLKLANPPVEQETVYERGRIDLRLIPFYNRIINICFAIEQAPGERAIGTLSRFLDDPHIGNSVTTKAETAGQKVYAGILESRIAATLARCGARRGFDVLAEYLNDVHHLLAAYARGELTAILPEDFGYAYEKWKQYIAGRTFPLPPTPRPMDTVEW